MKTIFNPSIRLVNRLRYPQKLLLLGAIAVIIVMILTYQLAQQSYTRIRDTQSEVKGVIYIKGLAAILQKIQDYRNLELTYFFGDQSLKDRISGSRDEVDQAISDMEELASKNGTNPKLQEDWGKIKAEWEATAKTDEKDTTNSKIVEYGNVIANIQKLVGLTCDITKLSLDPDIDTTYQIDMYCRQLPKTVEEAAAARDIGVEMLMQKNPENLNKEDFATQKILLERHSFPGIQNDIEKIIADNPSLNSIFGPLKRNLFLEAKESIDISNHLIYGTVTELPTRQSLQIQFGELLNSTYKLYSKTGESLSILLEQRIQKHKRMLYFNLAIVAVGLLSFIYLFIGVYLSIIKSIRMLVEGSNKIALGELSVLVNLESKDELTEVGYSFNHMGQTLVGMMDELRVVVTEAIHGNMQTRINLNGKTGFAKELSKNINEMSDSFQNIILDVTAVLEALSKGDLTKLISREYEGSFQKLKQDVNTTVQSLEALILGIKKTNRIISLAVQEISQGNKDLAKRTDQQAAALEETSASMEEITTMVKKNTESAKKANEMAQQASNVATKGGAIVSEVVKMMTGVNESSRQVSEIVNVIDGIAFQTNMLALNAAVEAARAGEQGKGFSVVAAEVRNLSQRTSTAAKEIKQLIGTSFENVVKGTQLVDDAGHTMGEIVKAVSNVTQIMSEIVNASVEQSNGIEQINTAINQMDQVTQQNNALVSEVANTAESTEAQSNHLNELVNVFKLSSESVEVEEGNNPRTSMSILEKHGAKKIKKTPPQNTNPEDEWTEF